jgi:hypothetical protein
MKGGGWPAREDNRTEPRGGAKVAEGPKCKASRDLGPAAGSSAPGDTGAAPNLANGGADFELLARLCRERSAGFRVAKQVQVRRAVR